MKEPQFLKVKFSALRPWEKNPRTATTEAVKDLAAKIKAKGQIKNFVCWQEDEDLKNGTYTIGGGNIRFLALRDILKIKPDSSVWISVNYPESEKEKIELSLLDNMTSGSYVEQQLAEMIYPYREEIDLKTFKLNFTEGTDLEKFLEGFGPGPDPEDIDEISDSDRHTISIFCKDDDEMLEMRRLLGIEDKKQNKIEAPALKALIMAANS